MSWLATALAGFLAVGTPLAANLIADAGARVTEPVVAAPAPQGSSTGPRHGGRPHPAEEVGTEVLAAEAPGPRDPSAAQPGTEPRPAPHLLVHVRPDLVARRNPWSGSPAVGTVATVSKYYGVPLVLWVEEVSGNGRWGRVELPYVSPRREGWIPLDGLQRETTWVTVDVDLSEHEVRVYKRDDLLFRTSGATGAPVSPTPTGDFFVTDRVPFPGGGSLGTFAFGISGIQPNLPPGWSGGNQLAIHGTNSPGTIGQSVSAGCVRVSEATLDRLLPLLRLGTPVVIHA
jgi:hypothetical protein